MTQTQMGVAFALVLITGMGWYSKISDQQRQVKRYQQEVAEAADFEKRGLYQKAGENYKEALGIKKEEAIYEKMMDAYEKAYEEKEDRYKEYMEAAEMAQAAYPENPHFALAISRLYIQKNDYANAFYFLDKAKKAGSKDKTFQKEYRKMLYSFKTLYGNYNSYYPLSNGFYGVKNKEGAGYIPADGESSNSLKQEFVGPIGEKGYRLLRKDGKTILMDKNEVTQGVFSNKNPEDIGYYAEDRIPIKEEGEYSYYNALGDRLFGGFSEASRFQKGKAVVKKAKRVFFIDSEGKEVELKYTVKDEKGKAKKDENGKKIEKERKFEAVQINPDYSFIAQGCILAKEDGAYHIYDENWEQVSDFSAEEVDGIGKDGIFAFSKKGKWGFANLKGEVVLEPKYKAAKSFSEGLAGVMEDDYWGFINLKGEMVITPQFFGVDYFNKKGACVVETTPEVFQFIKRNIVKKEIFTEDSKDASKEEKGKEKETKPEETTEAATEAMTETATEAPTEGTEAASEAPAEGGEAAPEAAAEAPVEGGETAAAAPPEGGEAPPAEGGAPAAG